MPSKPASLISASRSLARVLGTRRAMYSNWLPSWSAQPGQRAEVVDVEPLESRVASAGASSAVITGSATTILPWIESASGSPLRSRMSPRSAGRVTLTMFSAAAMAAYDLGSTPCSWTSRAPKKDSTIAITIRPNRSRNCGVPRRASCGTLRVLLVVSWGNVTPSGMVITNLGGRRPSA